MSDPSTKAVILFCLFAFLFFGVLLTTAAVLDRRRVRDVKEAIPERSEGASPADVADAAAASDEVEDAPPRRVEVHRAYEAQHGDEEPRRAD